MTESNQHKSPPETQHQRWLKYGANVLLSVVVVILLAAAITYLAQRSGRRIDTTVGRVNSLKPQTLNIINQNNQKIKLVALYQQTILKNDKEIQSPYREPVLDLLQSYTRAGKNIEADAIDPVKNPTKSDALIAEVTQKYSGEIQKYKDLVAAFRTAADQIRKLSGLELEKVKHLDIAKLDPKSDEYNALNAPENLPAALSKVEDSVDRKLKLKTPDYKAASLTIEAIATNLSEVGGRVVEIFSKAKDDTTLSEPIRKYMADSTKTYDQIKKISDDLLKQVKNVGELKLDELTQSLHAKDAILVMGEKDMRVLPFEQVWKVDSREIRDMAAGQELKPRFAGEQQVSTALLALSQDKKPRVAFIRFGGPPLTPPGFPPFQRGGVMAEVAARLREYNFDVVEKDLSGMWAMQSQMGGQPPTPEASDEELKGAIWVVLMFPLSQQGPMQPPADFKKVADHLAHGGSALLMFAPQTDNFGDTLKQWGIDVNTNAVAVHEPIKPSEGKQAEILEDALRYPFVFNIDNYGDHLITRPLRSLQSWLVPLEIVKTTSAPDVTVTPIIPVPDSPKSWGESNLASLEEAKAEYEPDKGDIPGPIYGGAAAENKKTGNRLVVIASPMFAFDRWVNETDPAMLRRGLVVARFPGNAELFNNSIFWLAKMEPMIAISPAAMEVSRIASMSDGALKFWRIGALLVGLPGAVVLAGACVYLARRD